MSRLITFARELIRKMDLLKRKEERTAKIEEKRDCDVKIYSSSSKTDIALLLRSVAQSPFVDRTINEFPKFESAIFIRRVSQPPGRLSRQRRQPCQGRVVEHTNKP